MARRLWMLAGIAAITATAVGCSQTDAAITAQVNNRLIADESTRASQIEVATASKVVTLAGNVDSVTVKSKAVELARATNGVTDVVDKLVVPAQSTQPALGAATSNGQQWPAAGIGFGPAMMGMHRGEMGMAPESMMREMAPTASAAPAPSPSDATASRPLSTMPGMPGVSHLHHIGATEFFLDQPAVGLTPDQQSKLRGIKERALSTRTNADRAIEQAEQELWALTGAGTDAARVEAKIAEIERARTGQRIEFIRSVGEAIDVLTPEQRNALLGTAAR